MKLRLILQTLLSICPLCIFITTASLDSDQIPEYSSNLAVADKIDEPLNMVNTNSRPKDETTLCVKASDFSYFRETYKNLSSENLKRSEIQPDSNAPMVNKNPSVRKSMKKSSEDFPLPQQNHSMEQLPGNILRSNGSELSRLPPEPLCTHLQPRIKRQSSESPKSTLLQFQKNLQEQRSGDSLELLVKGIIEEEMRLCELIIAIDRSFFSSSILDYLAALPMSKQIVEISSAENLAFQISWPSLRCQGTFLLISDPDPLIEFGNSFKFQWDYGAKVVIIGLSHPNLELFAQTMKGKKTEKIIGVVKGNGRQNFKIFMNLLYWGKGVKRIGVWKQQRFTSEVVLFPDKVSNLRKGVVKVVMFDWPPIMFILKDSDGKVIGRYGRDVVVVETLAKLFNFTLVYVDISQDWGTLLPNGSFTGLVGYLDRDLGDIAIANLYPSALNNRHKHQDYSAPLSEDRGCFLARVDPPLPRWQNPSLPFQPATWLALFIGFLVVGPVLYVLANMSNKIGGEDYRYTYFTESFLVNVAIHFEHPLGVLPKRGGTQIFTLFLLLYSIILTTGYKANLTAFLTVTRQPKAIETIEDLYLSGMPVRGIPWYITALGNSENPYLRGLLDKYEVRYTFDDVKEELLAGKAINVNSILYLEASAALVKTKKGKPLLRFLKECVSSYSVGLGYAMNSPLKENINKYISRMFESGIVIKWFRQTNEFYWKLKEEETAAEDYGGDDWYDSTEGVIPLGMGHMQGIFIVFACGIILSIVSFFTELLRR